MCIRDRFKRREKDGVAQPAMLIAAANKARDYLRHASGRQLGADWATDCCQIILTAFQESQEAKGYRPYDPQSDYNPQEECCLDESEVQRRSSRTSQKTAALQMKVQRHQRSFGRKTT